MSTADPESNLPHNPVPQIDPSVLSWSREADIVLGFHNSGDAHITPDARAAIAILEAERHEAVAREFMDAAKLVTDGLIAAREVMPHPETIEEINGAAADVADIADDTSLAPDVRMSRHLQQNEARLAREHLGEQKPTIVLPPAHKMAGGVISTTAKLINGGEHGSDRFRAMRGDRRQHLRDSSKDTPRSDRPGVRERFSNPRAAQDKPTQQADS